MNKLDRTTYAKRFNTLPEYVKSWQELTDRQKSLACARFANYHMIWYVYQIGTSGDIISRRRR